MLQSHVKKSNTRIFLLFIQDKRTQLYFYHKRKKNNKSVDVHIRIYILF